MTVPLYLLAIIYFATIFFGGAHVWSQSILVFSIAIIAVIAIWQWIFHNFKSSNIPLKIIYDPLSILGVIFIFWVAIQITPLPLSTIHIISPQTYSLWESTYIFGKSSCYPLSLYPFITQNGLIFCITLLAFYWFALYGIKSRRQIGWTIMGLFLLGLTESLYALVQLISNEPYCLWWKKTVGSDVATGTFIDRNHLAGFLSMLICLGVGYVWAIGKEKRILPLSKRSTLFVRIEGYVKYFGNKGIMVLLCVAVMIAALLSSASRGGALTLIAGLIFMAGLAIARSFRNRKAFALMLMMSIVCMYVGYVAADRVVERFTYFGASFEDRLKIAQATFRMGKDFFFTGTGFGTFEFVFPGYQDYNLNVLVDYAHNDWAQMFAETGAIGFLIIFIGFVWFIWSSITLWQKRHDTFSVGIGLGGIGASTVIAIHSLSEFNLHMPANTFLLAIILAITSLSLHSHKHQEQEFFSYKKEQMKIPLWTAISIALIVTFGSEIIVQKNLKNWHADMLARTVWNSTIPFKTPSDETLVKAWSLAPGNATYWSWVANRVFYHPEISKKIASALSLKASGETKDLDIYLWTEGIKRNPTDWKIWRHIGWASLLRSQKDRDYYLPVARNALSMACRLHPYAPGQHLEYGTIELASNTYLPDKENKFFWKEAFKKTLILDPGLSPRIADQLILYLREDGVKSLKEILSDDSHSYLLTARYLLEQGYENVGLQILKQGEMKRTKEIDKLWQEYINPPQGGFSSFKKPSKKKRGEIINKILSLDPGHPGALLGKGDVLNALRNQEKRSGVLKDLNHLPDIIWILEEFKDQKNISQIELAYYLGRIAEEQEDFKEAKIQFQRTLGLHWQYFPAQIHLKNILRKSALPIDKMELERIERNIQMFAMNKVVPSVWQWAGNFEGTPSWRVPFRVAEKKNRIEIIGHGNKGGAWKLLLDGRFADAWTGTIWHSQKTILIPAGEHEFRLIYFGDISQHEQKQLPFELEVRFAN